jgi:hypothetical protein
MEHLDSRGVRRTDGVSLEDGVLRIWREHAGFDQRFSAELGPDVNDHDGNWDRWSRETLGFQPPAPAVIDS